MLTETAQPLKYWCKNKEWKGISLATSFHSNLVINLPYIIICELFISECNSVHTGQYMHVYICDGVYKHTDIVFYNKDIILVKSFQFLFKVSLVIFNKSSKSNENKITAITRLLNLILVHDSFLSHQSCMSHFNNLFFFVF